MARKPAARKQKEVTGLLDAISFIEPACKEDGMDYQTHCIISHKWAMGFDGALTAAHPIVEELSAFPRLHTLKTALSKVDGAVAITQDRADVLKISTARATFDVECLSALDWPQGPDAMSVLLPPDKEEAFKTAVGVLNSVIKEAGETIVASSIKIGANSMVASDGTIIVEYWHGLGLPGDAVVPKAFVSALAKSARRIVGMGVSDRSFTVYFAAVQEGGPNPWLKTQLYSEPYPDTDRIWGMVDFGALAPVDPHFWAAVETVTRFSEVVYIHKDKIVSADGKTAKYDVEAHASDAPIKTSGKRLKLVSFMDKIALGGQTPASGPKPILLTGGMYRCVLSTIGGE